MKLDVLTLSMIQEAWEDHKARKENYKLYLNPKEIQFWQSMGVLPSNIKEGDMVCGGKLVITRPIKKERK